MDQDTTLSIVINIAMTVAIILIIFGAAFKFGWKPFSAYIARRQAAAVDAITEADAMKAEAQRVQEESERKMKEINEESAKIIARTEETAKKLAAERNEKMEEELQRKREIADKQLEQEKKRLEEEMEHKVLEKATEVASQFLTSKASPENTELQIESFLEKLGDE